LISKILNYFDFKKLGRFTSVPASFQRENIPIEKLNNEIELDAVVDEDISEIFKTKVMNIE